MQRNANQHTRFVNLNLRTSSTTVSRSGFSARQTEPSYAEWLEFSSRIEYRRFKMLRPVTMREISRANIDGLLLAILES